MKRSASLLLGLLMIAWAAGCCCPHRCCGKWRGCGPCGGWNGCCNETMCGDGCDMGGCGFNPCGCEAGQPGQMGPMAPTGGCATGNCQGQAQGGDELQRLQAQGWTVTNMPAGQSPTPASPLVPGNSPAMNPIQISPPRTN